MSKQIAIQGVKMSIAAASSVEETGADVADDVARLRSGAVSPRALYMECIEGAGDDRLQSWRDYVFAVSYAAGVETSDETYELAAAPAASAAELAREVGRIVGDDGTGDIRVIVDCALADDPAATASDIAELVREARADAAAERAADGHA